MFQVFVQSGTAQWLVSFFSAVTLASPFAIGSRAISNSSCNWVRCGVLFFNAGGGAIFSISASGRLAISPTNRREVQFVAGRSAGSRSGYLSKEMILARPCNVCRGRDRRGRNSSSVSWCGWGTLTITSRESTEVEVLTSTLNFFFWTRSLVPLTDCALGSRFLTIRTI